MTYQNILKKYNISKFKYVKNLLKKNDIFVQDLMSVYMILFIKNGKYNDFASLLKDCHGSIYEKDTNILVTSLGYSKPLYIPYDNKNSINLCGLLILIMFIIIIFIIYKYT
jgi:hypothetical protein